MGRGVTKAAILAACWAVPLSPGQAADRLPKHERAVAEREAARDRRWYGTAFAMVEAEARLPTVPYKIVSATLPLRDAYLFAVAADRVVVPRFTLPIPFVPLHGNSLDLEGQAVQHVGRERDTEVTASAIVRSGQFGVAGHTSANLAWGNGLSYALDRPTDERGPSGEVGVDTRHLQYHMSFEVEATGANPRLHYVLRLHHRSGIYGLISPARTGSNYLGLGMRLDLGRR